MQVAKEEKHDSMNCAFNQSPMRHGERTSRSKCADAMQLSNAIIAWAEVEANNGGLASRRRALWIKKPSRKYEATSRAQPETGESHHVGGKRATEQHLMIFAHSPPASV